MGGDPAVRAVGPPVPVGTLRPRLAGEFLPNKVRQIDSVNLDSQNDEIAKKMGSTEEIHSLTHWVSKFFV